MGDARTLIEATPTAALSRIFILYPDPWPKRRHNRRRFVSRETVAELARAARPGATVRFATDIDDYAGWTLSRFLASPAFSLASRKTPTTGAGRGTTGRRPATRPRRSSPGGRRFISRLYAVECAWADPADFGRIVTKRRYPIQLRENEGRPL